MLKRLLLGALVVFFPSYSYSESIQPYYGTTPNAAINGHSWSMDNVLPEPPGLDINAIIYNYEINKDVNDSAKVHVQNENANGTGYIFRETDEWKPGSLSGTEIRKVVPVIPNIPRAAWGDGSIEVEGNASVEDATVIYSYKVEPCYDPQFDPNCPGYVTPVPVVPEIPEIEIYDATQDEYVSLNDEERLLVDENEEQVDREKEEDEEEAEEKKRKYRLEKVMSVIDATALFNENLRIRQINDATQMTPYYGANIRGGEYKDTVVLVDKKLEDSKAGLRNGLAQQILHEQMIDMQYD